MRHILTDLLLTPIKLSFIAKTWRPIFIGLISIHSWPGFYLWWRCYVISPRICRTIAKEIPQQSHGTICLQEVVEWSDETHNLNPFIEIRIAKPFPGGGGWWLQRRLAMNTTLLTDHLTEDDHKDRHNERHQSQTEAAALQFRLCRSLEVGH